MWSAVMRFIGRFSSYLSKNRTIFTLCLFIVLNLTAPRIFTMRQRLSRSRPHATLTGLNCPLEEGVMSIKTDEIWESRVVKVSLSPEIWTLKLVEICTLIHAHLASQIPWLPLS